MWLFGTYITALLHLQTAHRTSSVCQDFGAQRDVASCRKRERRGKSKTGHLEICQGSSPDPPFCPWGEDSPEEAVSLPLCFYPPSSALALLRSALNMFSLLILLSLSQSQSNRRHLALSRCWQPPVLTTKMNSPAFVQILTREGINKHSKYNSVCLK